MCVFFCSFLVLVLIVFSILHLFRDVFLDVFCSAGWDAMSAKFGLNDKHTTAFDLISNTKGFRVHLRINDAIFSHITISGASRVSIPTLCCRSRMGGI